MCSPGSRFSRPSSSSRHRCAGAPCPRPRVPWSSASCSIISARRSPGVPRWACRHGCRCSSRWAAGPTRMCWVARACRRRPPRCATATSATCWNSTTPTTKPCCTPAARQFPRHSRWPACAVRYRAAHSARPSCWASNSPAGSGWGRKLIWSRAAGSIPPCSGNSAPRWRLRASLVRRPRCCATPSASPTACRVAITNPRARARPPSTCSPALRLRMPSPRRCWPAAGWRASGSRSPVRTG